MTLDDVKQLNAAATQSAKDQRQLNADVLNGNLMAGEQIVLQNAANVVTRLAQEQALNPNP